MQLHDFNDMNAFPCNLKSLTVCLSEVIFMEGFMRKVYQSLSSVEVLHLIGRFRRNIPIHLSAEFLEVLRSLSSAMHTELFVVSV
jgi:hypothetical protein